MPKVTEDYINKKKSEILDASFEVFQHKPLYEITMLDVIKQAKLSKGGIYRYFSDIDSVIIAMINRETRKNNYREIIDKIIEDSDTYSHAIDGLLNFLGQYIDESSDTLGKIQFELTVLIANHPEKAEKISSRLTEHENGQYLIMSLFQKIMEGVQHGEFQPSLPLEETFSFIRVYIEGLVKIVVLERCYGGNVDTIEPRKMMNMLSKTVFGILDCTIDMNN